jgi:hypothetical protein
LRSVFLPDADAGVADGDDTVAACARIATDALTLCK